VDFRVIVFHKPESLAAEHFKVLRGNIMHPADGRKIKSILVTSALEQEGKSMVSCNLAVSIAQSLDPYVLLIDADVRRPNVHNMLGLSKVKGLTDYLGSNEPLSEYLVKCAIDKMTILQAGSMVRNPAEIMTSEKMKHLLEEARQRYEDRFIIIDSPPVNLAAETLILAQQVDAIVIVVRYGISDKNAIEEALSKLDREKILGMVFNGFEVTPRKYTYYKKKYYDSTY
jgi:exopolysaccharide/PEP-CTERM locus tyrosine autokinase